MVLESCSLKRLLLFTIFIGGITLLIFIRITSSSALSGLNATIATEATEGGKDHKNSSNKCWLREENTIVKECHLCSNRPECINISFIETVECKFSGLAYRSCHKPIAQASEKNFWLFQGSQFVLAVISLCFIQYKKIQFHKKLMKRIQKQLDSVTDIMSSLFVDIIDLDETNGQVVCSLRTAIVLFVCQYIKAPVILVVPKHIENVPNIFKFSTKSLCYKTILENDLPKPAADCLLPVFQNDNGYYCTAGFCTSLRMLIKSIEKHWIWLLGFRQSCLSACAEVSSWTKYCEVQLQASIKSFFNYQMTNEITPFEIPKQLARFECHLSQPLQIHNINKRLNEKTLHPTQRFADEDNPTLSDLLILPNIHIAHELLGENIMNTFLPLTFKWYKSVLERLNIGSCLESIIFDRVRLPNNVILPEVPLHSLYKCDLRRYNPRAKTYVKQNVQDIIQVFNTININIDLSSNNMHPIDWDELPYEVRPSGGDIPDKRLIRKTQQLENLIHSTLKVAKDGDTVVDFCCGSGHLGIVIAYLVPSLTVILVDNKEESLRRARERIDKLNLKNIMIVHSNLDYFNANFQVGLCLHGCGVATDLVLEKCLLQNASFVVCPCCYGGVQDNHILEYPRSQALRQANFSFEDYLVLCHCADQTHFDPNCTKTQQGYTCMAAVDKDRATRAVEVGYSVTLSKLEPPTCTPKNNMLIGIPL